MARLAREVTHERRDADEEHDEDAVQDEPRRIAARAHVGRALRVQTPPSFMGGRIPW
jgi:hypothetical protein